MPTASCGARRTQTWAFKSESNTSIHSHNQHKHALLLYSHELWEQPIFNGFPVYGLALGISIWCALYGSTIHILSTLNNFQLFSVLFRIHWQPLTYMNMRNATNQIAFIPLPHITQISHSNRMNGMVCAAWYGMCPGCARHPACLWSLANVRQVAVCASATRVCT